MKTCKHTHTRNWGRVLAGRRRLPAGPSRFGSPGRRPAAAALRLQSSDRPAWSPPTSEMVHTAPDLAHTHTISTSTITITRLHSVYGNVRLPQTEIFQQLLNWFPWNFGLIFEVPRGWSLLTLVILGLFSSATTRFNYYSRMSTQLFDGSTWNWVQTFMLTSGWNVKLFIISVISKAEMWNIFWFQFLNVMICRFFLSFMIENEESLDFGLLAGQTSLWDIMMSIFHNFIHILQKLKYSRVMYRVRYTPALAAAKQKRMTIKMEGYGETHTSTPNTTDRVREVSRVLDLPSLKRNTHVNWINLSDTSVHLSTLSRGTSTTYWQIK